MANTTMYPAKVPTAVEPNKVMHVQHTYFLIFANLLHFFPFLYVPTVGSVPEPSGMYPHELFWVFGAHLIILDGQESAIILHCVFQPLIPNMCNINMTRKDKRFQCI